MKIEELTAKILENNPSIDPKTIKAADLALMEIAEGLITIEGFVDIEE